MKKSNIWDGILEEKEPSGTKKVLIGLSSWIAVVVFGLISFAGLLWLAAALTDTSDNLQIIRLWLVYAILAVGVVGMATKFVKNQKDSWFLTYAVLPLKIGIGVNLFILILALAGFAMLSADVLTGKQPNCSPLKNQITNIQAATVPIATSTGTGTAFAVRDEHTLLTAYHVVEGASRVYANYKSGEVPIKVIDTAPEYDLALLRISEPQPSYLKLYSRYEVGNPVYVNGYPGNTFFAGRDSLTSGIVSRHLSNSDLRLNSKDAPSGLTIVQTDAAVNPGNSGGPLVGECGVIGVVSMISDVNQLQYLGGSSEQGIYYAVSSETAAKRFNLPID